jgi:hypothetical protein
LSPTGDESEKRKASVEYGRVQALKETQQYQSKVTSKRPMKWETIRRSPLSKVGEYSKCTGQNGPRSLKEPNHNNGMGLLYRG